MKKVFYGLLLLACTSCAVGSQIGQPNSGFPSQASYQADAPITKSLFNDRAATISEENIKKILDGTYALPKTIRVSLVKLESTKQQRGYYWNNEQYLKSQQQYLDLFKGYALYKNEADEVLNRNSGWPPLPLWTQIAFGIISCIVLLRLFYIGWDRNYFSKLFLFFNSNKEQELTNKDDDEKRTTMMKGIAVV